MASQRPNNAGQSQITRDNMLNEPSDIHSQGQAQQTNFLQETGTHIGNMGHGVTEIGKGAFLGAATLASGAASGASSVALGAADAIKNTFGLAGSGGNATATNHPGSNTNMAASADPNSINIGMDESGYPNRPSFPHAP
ncbi:hypothetical protein ACS0TY_012461 [Phlomoides rotata]